MPFPETDRVIYRRNPLEEVICQLRFPTILRIGQQTPADFQESVRDEYPLFAEQVGGPGVLPPDIPREVQALLEQSLQAAAQRIYEFLSADNKWKVTLTRDWVALSTHDYVRWEPFRERLARVREALVQHYQPAFLSRIGLRYRDVIKRSVLELHGTAWSALLAPHIVGELAAGQVSDSIEHAAREVRIRLRGDRRRVMIRHGIARASPEAEECFVIDADFFTDTRTEPNNAGDVLSYFNQQAGRLFRWCICQRLHDAMGPESVSVGG